jgi:hypothetical protein
MRVRIEPVALGLVVAAVVPYIALKVSWLTGADIGVRDDAALAELHSTRMIVGNNLTILLELMAVALALALSSGWDDAFLRGSCSASERVPPGCWLRYCSDCRSAASCSSRGRATCARPGWTT